MAGRVTMAQSCLLSFPPYVLQATLISIATCNEIEKICRDFILCSDANNRKIHLMSWEMTCKPKDQGGLGFRSLRMLNQAYFLKLDAWIPGVPAIDSLIPEDIHSHVSNLPVSAYGVDGHWRWEGLNVLVPPYICAMIASINPPSGTDDDTPLWKDSLDGYCNVILAELWSLKYGIKLAIDLNTQFSLFEMDAREAVHMIDVIKSVPSSLRPLAADIRRVLWANGWQSSIVHINREANSAANWAAKFGHQRNWSSFLVDEIPFVLKALVANDVRRAAASPLRLP
ncbi:uncharacterized protein LOC114424196 [Glycine soja]|nr:uncharacterized protein LOC114424196 [Glycine soja]